MLIIANPASANGASGLRWSGIQARLRSEGVKFESALTQSPGHAAALARDAPGQGFETVVCVGGDGTLNEVVNGLMSVDEAVRPRLSIIPSGTGTDFARALGITSNLDASVNRLKCGIVKPIDIGLASFRRGDQQRQHYFINVAGLGFDGEVSDQVNRTSKRGGSVAYIVNVFKVLSRYQNKRAKIMLSQRDGASSEREIEIEGEFNSIVVSNGRYFGGGMKIAPNANLSDGLFDVILIGAMSRTEFALSFPRVYRGAHLTHPKVTELRATEVRVEVEQDQRMFLEAEGELLGEAPSHFRILPGALRLIH